MVDKVAMTIHVTQEERTQIEEMAREHGYDSTEAYLLALVKLDAETDEVNLETKEGIAEGLRQSLREMKAGLGRPIGNPADY